MSLAISPALDFFLLLSDRFSVLLPFHPPASCAISVYMVLTRSGLLFPYSASTVCRGADQCRMPFCGARYPVRMMHRHISQMHHCISSSLTSLCFFISADLGKQRVAVYPHRRAQHCYPNGILGIADIMIAKAKAYQAFLRAARRRYTLLKYTRTAPPPFYDHRTARVHRQGGSARRSYADRVFFSSRHSPTLSSALYPASLSSAAARSIAASAPSTSSPKSTSVRTLKAPASGTI